MDVIQKFMSNENGADTNTLSSLSVITDKFKKVIDGMVAMSVPGDLASLHLDVVNGLEKVTENIDDMKLYDTDVMITLSAITKYETNSELLVAATKKLNTAMVQKLNR